MSIDFIIITPSSYSIEVFYDRFSNNLFVQLQDNKRIAIEINNRFVFLEEWMPSEAELKLFFETLDQEDFRVIFKQMSNPKYFILTGGNHSLLYPIVKMVCNDPNILIDINLEKSPLFWGNQIVSLIRDQELK